MLEALITLLIWVAIAALVVYLVIYVLKTVGVELPGQVVRILWLILALVVILWLVRLMLAAGTVALPGG